MASTSEVFVSLPVKPPVKESIERLKADLIKQGVKIRNQSDVVALTITAYDIMYNSSYGGKLTQAVVKAIAELDRLG